MANALVLQPGAAAADLLKRVTFLHTLVNPDDALALNEEPHSIPVYLITKRLDGCARPVAHQLTPRAGECSERLMAEGSSANNRQHRQFKLVGSSMEFLSVVVPEDACFADIAEQVRAQVNLSPDQHVRIIAGGKEKMMHEPVTSVQPGVVLHYTVAATLPSGAAHTVPHSFHLTGGYPAPGNPPVQRPPDLLDLAEPGTVLLWVFGGVLALLWLCGLCFSRMFDRNSIIIIGMMTMAFLLPFGLSYLPVGAIMRPGARQQNHQNPVDQPQMQQQQDMPLGEPGALGGYSADNGYVPPRPRARVKPGQPLN